MGLSFDHHEVEDSETDDDLDRAGSAATHQASKQTEPSSQLAGVASEAADICVACAEHG